MVLNVNIRVHSSSSYFCSPTREPLNKSSWNCLSLVQISWCEVRFVFWQNASVLKNSKHLVHWPSMFFISHILKKLSSSNCSHFSFFSSSPYVHFPFFMHISCTVRISVCIKSLTHVQINILQLFTGDLDFLCHTSLFLTSTPG